MPPPTARQCAPEPAGRGGAAGALLWECPPLPARRGSLRNRQRGRASLPPLVEARAGSLGDEKLPGRTRSQPTPGLRLNSWRRSRVPAETRPPPPPSRALGASLPRRPGDFRPPGLFPADAAHPPPNLAAPAPAPRASPRDPRRAAPTGPGFRRAAPRPAAPA